MSPKPGPVKPGPVKPGPVKPGPVKPGPVKPGPAKPGPAKPGPAKPGPAKPGPARPLRRGQASRQGRLTSGPRRTASAYGVQSLLGPPPAANIRIPPFKCESRMGESGHSRSHATAQSLPCQRYAPVIVNEALRATGKSPIHKPATVATRIASSRTASLLTELGCRNDGGRQALRGGEVAQHERQDAAVAVVGELLLGIDSAQDLDRPRLAVCAGHLHRHLLPRLEAGKAPDGDRLLAG